MKPPFQAWAIRASLLCVLLAGCDRRDPLSGPVKEPRITGSTADAAVELRAEWKPKHHYDVTLLLEQSTQVRNRNTDEDFDRDITFRLDFDTAVLGDPGARPQSLSLSLNGLMFQLIREDIPLIHYDTRSKVAMLEDDQRTTEALDKLVGSRWRYRIAPDGSVGAAEIETNTPSSKALDSGSKVMGVSLVRRLFNPQFFRPFLELDYLPTNSVRVGESWPVERLLNAGTVGSVLFKGTCTFRGWQDNQGRRCARLDMAGEVVPPSGRLAGRSNRIIRGSSALEKGTLTSRIWFDPDQRLPVQAITDLNLMTVVTQRKARPKDSVDTNAPPAIRLQVPLNQRIRLRITDLGETVELPAAESPAEPAADPTPPDLKP
jgi:hypothetical protein